MPSAYTFVVLVPMPRAWGVGQLKTEAKRQRRPMAALAGNVNFDPQRIIAGVVGRRADRQLQSDVAGRFALNG